MNIDGWFKNLEITMFSLPPLLFTSQIEGRIVHGCIDITNIKVDNDIGSAAA